MTVTRVGTPRSAVEKLDRNLFLLVKGQKHFRGFLQRVHGKFRYVRLYQDRNIIRYVDGGAMSVDTTILHLLEEYGVDQIDYHWGGTVYRTTVSQVYKHGIHKPVGFTTDQWHLPLMAWLHCPSYRRAWVPQTNEEIVQEESDAAV